MTDKGIKIAVQRALDAFNRARGGYTDRETAMFYLLEALESDWVRATKGLEPPAPTFVQIARAACPSLKTSGGSKS